MTREEAIKIVRENMHLSYDEGNTFKALQTLVPELAEWNENERIRKEISTLYADIDSCISELLAARINKDAEAEGKALFRMEGLMVATLQDLSCVEDWLEKQKPSFRQIHDSIIWDRGLRTGIELEKQKEQKPLTDEEKEYIRTIKSIISDFIRDKKSENLAYYQRIYDWLDGRHVPFSCGHENGQPADPIFSKQEYESSPIVSKDTTSVKPGKKSGEDITNGWKGADLDRYLSCLQRLGTGNPQQPETINSRWFREHCRPQPKQEWSEEDEKEVAILEGYICSKDWSDRHIDRALGIVDELVNKVKSLRHQPKQEWSEEDELKRDNLVSLVEEIKRQPLKRLEDWDGYINWLKSLPKRFVLQPKVDWSEEDKRIVNDILARLEDLLEDNTRTQVFKTTIKSDIDFLKSLRPPLKDKEMKLKILKYLSTRCSSLEFEEVEDYLNNLRPSWKPSEEQMEALQIAAMESKTDFNTLTSLLADLMKL